MTLESLLLITLALLLLPLIMRLLRGPTAGDRILALEVIGGLALS